MSIITQGLGGGNLVTQGYGVQALSTPTPEGGLTPSSATSAYLTNSEFIARYDVSLVGQLLSDTTTKVSVGDIPTNATLSTILQDASGMVETAALVGGRYESADLTTLVTASNGVVSNGGMFIKRLVADLAMGLLRQRRGMAEDQPFGPFIQAMQTLADLRKGETILPFIETEKAGQASDTNIQPWQMYKQGRLTSVFNRFFGRRSDQENRY